MDWPNAHQQPTQQQQQLWRLQLQIQQQRQLWRRQLQLKIQIPLCRQLLTPKVYIFDQTAIRVKYANILQLKLLHKDFKKEI